MVHVTDIPVGASKNEKVTGSPQSDGAWSASCKLVSGRFGDGIFFFP
jgi:hypothetical protein